MTDGTPFSSQMSQESCKAKPRVLSSPRLLEEDSPEFPSQQLQATSSGGSESLSNLDLSHGPLVALEYLPFFRTYGQLLAEEELAPQPEAFRDQGGDQSVREEDSELPSGFFPYYRSKEESFPSLALPGRSCAGSRGPSTRREVQACRCCTRTISGDGSVSQGDAEGVWGSTGCPGPRETEGVQGSTGHPGPFKSGRHRGCAGQHWAPWALQVRETQRVCGAALGTLGPGRHRGCAGQQWVPWALQVRETQRVWGQHWAPWGPSDLSQGPDPGRLGQAPHGQLEQCVIG